MKKFLAALLCLSILAPVHAWAEDLPEDELSEEELLEEPPVPPDDFSEDFKEFRDGGTSRANLINTDINSINSKISALERRVSDLERASRDSQDKVRQVERTVSDIRRRIP